MTSFIFHAMVTRSFGPSYPATSSFLINNRAGRNSVWKGATLKHGIRYPELVIRNPESGIRNPESGIRNPESGICNPESGIRNPESRIENPESVNRYPESGFRNPESGIRNPESKIQNPLTGIQNPCWRDPTRSKQLSTVSVLGFQYRRYHAVTPISFLRISLALHHCFLFS